MFCIQLFLKQLINKLVAVFHSTSLNQYLQTWLTQHLKNSTVAHVCLPRDQGPTGNKSDQYKLLIITELGPYKPIKFIRRNSLTDTYMHKIVNT